MHDSSRREFLKAGLAATVALPVVTKRAAAAKTAGVAVPPQPGFSLYGMKSLPLDEAVRTCAAIGYDNVELSLLPGYATEPTQFGQADRRRLRDLLASLQLKVSCLMENLAAAASAADHEKNLERIARAAELAHDLGCEPIMETVLGGKPAEWPNIPEPMTERLRDWAAAGAKHDLTIAIKPHVGGAVHLAESCRQILDDIDSRHLRAVYDFSHYQVQGLPLEATIAALAPHIAFVHVKDGRRVDGKVQFLLPGEGDTNYVDLIQRLTRHGFQGALVVEVSGQIFNRPDYDPRAAAKRSFATLHAALHSEPLKS